MIQCDFCGADLGTEFVNFSQCYERNDGDYNVLCTDCIRKEVEADYVKDTGKAVAGSASPSEEARHEGDKARKGHHIQVQGVRGKRSFRTERHPARPQVSGGDPAEGSGGGLSDGFREGGDYPDFDYSYNDKEG